MIVVEKDVFEEFLRTPIARLEEHGLSLQVINSLESKGFVFIRQIQYLTSVELKKIVKNIGDKGVSTVQNSLKSYWKFLESDEESHGEIQAIPVQWRLMCKGCGTTSIKTSHDIYDGYIFKCPKCRKSQIVRMSRWK